MFVCVARLANDRWIHFEDYPLLNKQYNKLESWIDERLDQLIDAYYLGKSKFLDGQFSEDNLLKVKDVITDLLKVKIDKGYVAFSVIKLLLVLYHGEKIFSVKIL